MKEITVTDLAGLTGPRLIDVREPDEWNAGHVAGAALIPLGQLPARTGELPTRGPIYVMCHSGGRSGRAAAILEEQGYEVTNVNGGITAWRADGFPVVVGA